MRQFVVKTFFAIPYPVRRAVKRYLPTRVVELGASKIGAWSYATARTSELKEILQETRETIRQELSSSSLVFPSKSNIPTSLVNRVTSSPVLCRVTAPDYLTPFQPKKELHNQYGTLSAYVAQSIVRPNLIGARLWENDIRIAAYMDNLKTYLANCYAKREQTELISIIMPTRNRGKVIADAILSVLMQSYENWELFVVDDASDKPEAAEIVETFRDSRIRCIQLKNQVGNGRARNAGIDKASGTVIAYLDDDDQWDPDHLLVLFNQMRDAKAKIAYGAQAVWTGFNEETGLGNGFKSLRFAPFNRSLLENANYISMISLIHDHSILGGSGKFDTKLHRFLDWDLFLRLTEVDTPIAVPCITSHYFQARAAVSISSPADKTIALAAIRRRQTGRSDWTAQLIGKDGTKHVAYGVPKRARLARRSKLAEIPSEPIEIIIPNYEAAAQLEACVKSITQLTDLPYRITVVDNGSSHGTRQSLYAFCRQFSNVRFIEDDGPSGFSYAVNRGFAEIEDTDCDVLILNNDTVVTPDWLTELRYVLWKHSDAGMAVPRQVLPANSHIIKPHVPGAMDTYECDINLSSHHGNVLNPHFDQDDRLVELTFAPLFCSLVRADLIKQLSGLDARNGPHYRSDWILCDAIRRICGKRILYTPHSKVYHLQGVASATFKAAKGK
jgi:GT2 family glycosyltransferase